MKKLSMDVFNAHASGIDVGSREHWVAVDQDKSKVRKFGVYTSDHIEMIGWLKENDVRSIAMESTGSYWQTLFDALQQAGFEVVLASTLLAFSSLLFRAAIFDSNSSSHCRSFPT